MSAPLMPRQISANTDHLMSHVSRFGAVCAELTAALTQQSEALFPTTAQPEDQA